MFYDIYLYTLCYYICCLLWRMYEMHLALFLKAGCDTSGLGRAEGREPSIATIFRSDTTTTTACVRPTAVTARAAAATSAGTAAIAATATCALLPRPLEGSWSQVSLGPPNVRSIVAFMSTGLDPPFVCQGLLFLGIHRRSLPAGRHARRGVWFPSAYACWERRRRSVSGYHGCSFLVGHHARQQA
jgi:hypothetical protein